jgi:pyrroline-5-carboxylate reductase
VLSVKLCSGTTISVIGAGRIGSAIISSLRNHCGDSIKIIATGRREETLERAGKLGALAIRDNKQAVGEADMIVLSVKPHHFPDVVKQTGRDVWRGKLVVSVMAGVKVKTLATAMPGAEVYRAMTNINVLVGKASTAVANPENDSPSKLIVEELFRCMGEVYWVPEEYLDVWTSLAGSGPAFIAEIVDALVLGAMASGMPRDLAYKATLDVLEGTAILLRNANKHPATIRDEVITPAGTTIRGIMVMESEGIKSALMKTIEATYRRSIEIGIEIDQYVKKELNIS